MRPRGRGRDNRRSGEGRVLIFRRRARQETTSRHRHSSCRGLARQGEEIREGPLTCLALQFSTLDASEKWIPAFAGTTTFRVCLPGIFNPA